MKERKTIRVNGAAVEVSEEIYTEYYRLRRYEKTLTEKDARNRVVHYDAWNDGYLSGKELLTELDSATPEEIVLAELLRDKLYSSLAHLPVAERELIHALFFEGRSIAEVSKRQGVPQRTLGCRRDRILKKLRQLME